MSEKLGISELVTRVGDENIRLQNLVADMANVQATKHGTKVTFYTDPAFLSPNTVAFGNGEWQGVILWMPRVKVDAILAERQPHGIEASNAK